MASGSGAVKGAAGGAAAGTAILPGWGTAIGAVAGGLLGAFGGGDDNEAMLDQWRREVAARNAPQIGGAAQAATSGFRSNQANLINRLEALSSGQGPSLAQAQLNEATDRNIASQQSFAQSGRGNQSFANLIAANNIQNLGQSAAQQSVGARIAEQQMALQALGGAIQQGRASDEATNAFNAQQANFIAEANLTAKLKAMGLQDDAILNILAQMRQAQAMPSLGDQILAGGSGALGQWASQQAQSKANAGTQGGSGTLSVQYPHGGGEGPITSPRQVE